MISSAEKICDEWITLERKFLILLCKRYIFKHFEPIKYVMWWVRFILKFISNEFMEFLAHACDIPSKLQIKLKVFNYNMEPRYYVRLNFLFVQLWKQKKNMFLIIRSWMRFVCHLFFSELWNYWCDNNKIVVFFCCNFFFASIFVVKFLTFIRFSWIMYKLCKQAYRYINIILCPFRSKSISEEIKNKIE